MSVEPIGALPHLTVIKLASVLTLEDDHAFIVGGQALNLWAERYAPHCDALAAYGPFTSKDLDYFGHAQAAQKLADALKGTIIFPPFGDHTPQSALVRALIDGREIEIDFLQYVIGVRVQDLERQAVELRVPLNGEEEGYLDIPVMHPLHCLQSRVTNNVKLERMDDVALRQLRAAPFVLQQYVEEMLKAGELREVHHTIQGLYRFLRTDECGLKIPELAMVDPLNLIIALMRDKRLDLRYRWFNLRSMRWRVNRKRASMAVRRAAN